MIIIDKHVEKLRALIYCWWKYQVVLALWKTVWTFLKILGLELSQEKEMTTHSTVLAWRIPGTGEPLGCCLWGRTESDMTEAT